MPEGKLYEVVDRPKERWTFLEPGTLLYLASFADMTAAETYAGLSGYEIGTPVQIKGAAVDAAQPPLPPPPAEVEIPPANSRMPPLRQLAPKPQPKAEAPKPTGKTLGFKPKIGP